MIHSPPNKAPLRALYAWVSVDKDGNEGICGAMIPGIGGIPLVTGDKRMADGQYRELAESMGRLGKHDIRLVTFVRAEVT